MQTLFFEYPPCSTCKKAKTYLQQHDFAITVRHIVNDPPTVEELRAWHKQANIPLKKFFNTSGNLYKELHLKDVLPTLGEDEQYQLLASNGMLIKRPLLINEEQILIGFQLENYEKLCSEC